MKRRLIVLLTLIGLGGLLLVALFLTNGELTLPNQAAELLSRYRAAQAQQLEVVHLARATHPESLDQQMVQLLRVSTGPATRPSPGLYASAVIQPLAPDAPDYPPQEVWCVTVRQDDGQQEQLLLGMYERLAQADWLLYEVVAPDATGQLGCPVNGLNS